MEKFKIILENFSGPLDKILELISKNKLNINKISLSKITDSFLDYLNEFKKKYGQNEEFYEIIADFIAIAVRLLLIKAKTLSPTLEDDLQEDEEDNLEDQLKKYQEFKRISIFIYKKFNSNKLLLKRLPLADRKKIFFSPGKATKNEIYLSLKNFLKERQEFEKVLKKVKLKKKLIDLEKTMEETYKFIKKIKQINFKSLINKKEKIEIITIFTSLLHLNKKGFIEINQEKPFSEIEIKLLK